MFARIILIEIVLAIAPMSVGASEFSGAATLASEYVYRGQAKSGHNPAVSIGLDYEHDSGFFGGVWASTIDQSNRFSRRYTELDYYLGYHFEPAEPIVLTLSIMHYTYPGHEGSIDYAYTEGALSATIWDRYSVEFAYTDDFYGIGEPARHWALRGEWPASVYLVASAGIGLADLTAIRTNRYGFWDVGLSTRWSRLTFDLRWHDNEEIEGTLAGISAGSRLVFSASLGF